MERQKFLVPNPSCDSDSQGGAGQERKGDNPASLEDSEDFAIPFSARLLIKRDKMF